MFSLECRNRVLPKVIDCSCGNPKPVNKDDFRVKDFFNNNLNTETKDWVCIGVYVDPCKAEERIKKIINLNKKYMAVR